MTASAPLTLEIVCATHLSAEDFWRCTALGQSLAFNRPERRIVTRLACGGTQTLAQIGNQAIDDTGTASGILVFLHDDLWLQDWDFVNRIAEGLAHHDLIGLAGCTRRFPGQLAWFQVPPTERHTLSGIVAQGSEPATGVISAFGPVPQACELLDGMLLAARKSTLVQHGLRFDPGLDLHFAGVDLCRSARQRGLRLGTWPLSVTHQGLGHVNPVDEATARQRYLARWPD